MSTTETESVPADQVTDAREEMPPPASQRFGAELKKLRQRKGETQSRLAEAVNVSRVTVAQWEAAKHLPSTTHARLLDDHFDSDYLLGRLAELARRPSRRPSELSTHRLSDISVQQLFHRVGKSVREQINAGSIPHPRNTQTDSKGSAAFAGNSQLRQLSASEIAYGIKTLLLVDGPFIDLEILKNRLLNLRLSAEGWSHPFTSKPRPEVTAVVLDALFRIGTSLSVDQAFTMVNKALDSDSLHRPHVLSTVLQTTLRLSPQAPLNEFLLDKLLACRTSYQGTFLWPAAANPGSAPQPPSTAHTARAVVALQTARASHNEEKISQAIDDGLAWLRSSIDFANTSEEYPSSSAPNTSTVVFEHFTAAWVLQALANTQNVPFARIRGAVSALWTFYDQESGLWSWQEGSLPLWMTHDAIAALRTTSLAFRSFTL